MTPRLGHIAFLNVLPLTYALAHGAAEGLDILRASPARLNCALEEKGLDVSGISSITYARHAGELLILPDVCIASDGDVRSVLLVSRVPAEEIGTRRVLLSDKSASSHALLKIILRRAYQAAPDYEVRALTPADPVPDGAAASLFIGDDALELYHRPPEGCRIYDLAREWKLLTGHRMVFGIWAAARTFAAVHPAELRMIHARAALVIPRQCRCVAAGCGDDRGAAPVLRICGGGRADTRRACACVCSGLTWSALYSKI